MKRFTFDEWLAWRRAGITGTDASMIMGALPKEWGTVGALWLDKTGRETPRKETTPQMKRGKKLEPAARLEYERLTGIPMPALCIERTDNPMLRVSVDGINDRAGRALEIKCSGKPDHATAQDGLIPKKYLWQCVHILMVCELPELDYFSFDGKTGVIVTMKRDLELEKVLLAEETRFWNFVISDTPPPKDIPAEAIPPKKSWDFPVRKTSKKAASAKAKPAPTFKERYQNVLEFRRNRR